jgi:hypothetical protein
MTVTVSCSYWLRSSNPKQGLHQRRSNLSRPLPRPRCRSCHRVHSTHPLLLCSNLCNNTRRFTLALPRQPRLGSPPSLKQVSLKPQALRPPRKPILLLISHPIYSRFCKALRLNNQVHLSRRKAQRLYLAHIVLSRQHCPQDKCVLQCHRTWQGHRHPQCPCKVGWGGITRVR